MDLWVRSQDRERLIKPIDFYIEANLNFHTAVPIDFDIYALNFANSDIKIGKYKTKERAIKVLDEIQDLFITKEIFKTEFTKDGLTMMNKQPSSVVYKMPQE